MVEYKCGEMKANVTSIGLFLHYTSLFVMFILSVHRKFKRRKLKRENRRSIHCVRGIELCIFHSLCSCLPAENMIALYEVTQAKRKNTVNRQAEVSFSSFQCFGLQKRVKHIHTSGFYSFQSVCNSKEWCVSQIANIKAHLSFQLMVDAWRYILLYRPFWYAHYNSKLSWPNNWCELPSVKTHTKSERVLENILKDPKFTHTMTVTRNVMNWAVIVFFSYLYH